MEHRAVVGARHAPTSTKVVCTILRVISRSVAARHEAMNSTKDAVRPQWQDKGRIKSHAHMGSWRARATCFTHLWIGKCVGDHTAANPLQETVRTPELLWRRQVCRTWRGARGAMDIKSFKGRHPSLWPPNPAQLWRKYHVVVRILPRRRESPEHTILSPLVKL